MNFMLALNVTIYGLGIVFLALLVLMVAIMLLTKAFSMATGKDLLEVRAPSAPEAAAPAVASAAPAAAAPMTTEAAEPVIAPLPGKILSVAVEPAFAVMVAVHAATLVGAWGESLLVPWRSDARVAAGVFFAAATALRWWVIATLGERWSTRVLVLPGAPPVRGGPYRWLRHPNYLAVVDIQPGGTSGNTMTATINTGLLIYALRRKFKEFALGAFCRNLLVLVVAAGLAGVAAAALSWVWETRIGHGNLALKIAMVLVPALGAGSVYGVTALVGRVPAVTEILAVVRKRFR